MRSGAMIRVFPTVRETPGAFRLTCPFAGSGTTVAISLASAHHRRDLAALQAEKDSI
jgi:hypothetical protein